MLSFSAIADDFQTNRYPCVTRPHCGMCKHLLFSSTDSPAAVVSQFCRSACTICIANFNDVVSDLPFAIVGIWGWIFLAGKSSCKAFIQQREPWPYFVVFLGLLWTNTRLVWDRMPMTLAFMPIVAAMIMERLDGAWGLRLLPVLVAIGIASVLPWRFSELRGAGELRFYAAVQLYSVLTVLVLLFVHPRHTRNGDFAWVLFCYVLAKVFEAADRRIFQLGEFVSGHMLKYLPAGAAAYFILRMLQKRRP